MKCLPLLLLLLLILNWSCSSHSPRAARIVASVEAGHNYGPVSLKFSRLQIFPAERVGEHFQGYLFLRLNGPGNAPVDIEANEVVLRDTQGNQMDFQWRRLRKGRYYLITELTEDQERVPLELLLQGQAYPQAIQWGLRAADERYSKIEIVEKQAQQVSLRLTLKDSQGNYLSSALPPEILLEGGGTSSALLPNGPGVWEFSITYPALNSIIYISVRTQRSKLERLLRLQHIQH